MGGYYCREIIRNIILLCKNTFFLYDKIVTKKKLLDNENVIHSTIVYKERRWRIIVHF